MMGRLFNGLSVAFAAMSLVLAALVLAALLSGCGGDLRRAQVAAQTSLVATAEALDATDRHVAVAIQRDVNRAVASVQERCAEEVCLDPIGQLRVDLAPVYALVTGLERTRDALSLLQGVAEVWYATEALPADWPAVCEALGVAVGELLDLLDGAGVGVPPALTGAGPGVAMLCRVAVAAGGAR